MILHIAMVLLLILFFFGYLVGFFTQGKPFKSNVFIVKKHCGGKKDDLIRVLMYNANFLMSYSDGLRI